MDVDEYQINTQKTAIYGDSIKSFQHSNAEFTKNAYLRLAYCGLKLAGEAGEVSEKIGKLLRDKNGNPDHFWCDDLAKELGDVLWYVSQICNEIGIGMDTVMYMNVEKLLSRQERGTLQGSGDER